mmetsp:Transcript_18116/g.54654  ORF Transcript_18116/g.54654 Transcript_18116/m.54654 type:complete len:162 (-) Transcript_18116:98-583(-)
MHELVVRANKGRNLGQMRRLEVESFALAMDQGRCNMVVMAVVVVGRGAAECRLNGLDWFDRWGGGGYRSSQKNRTEMHERATMSLAVFSRAAPREVQEGDVRPAGQIFHMPAKTCEGLRRVLSQTLSRRRTTIVKPHGARTRWFVLAVQLKQPKHIGSSQH